MVLEGVPIVSIKVIPTGATSVSSYIARIVAILEDKGYKPIVTPDTTVISVRDLAEIGSLLKIIHDELYAMGINRIISILMIDDRRDIPERKPEDLVKSVKAKIEEEKSKLKKRTTHSII